MFPYDAVNSEKCCNSNTTMDDEKKSCELKNVADKKEQKDFEINKILSTTIEEADALARDLAAISIFISGQDNEIFANLFAELQAVYDDAKKAVYVEGLATKLLKINSLYYQLKQISQAIKEIL